LCDNKIKVDNNLVSSSEKETKTMTNTKIFTEKLEDGRFLVSITFLDDDHHFSLPVTAPTESDAVEAALDFATKFRNQA
jgi:hypothetical protein